MGEISFVALLPMGFAFAFGRISETIRTGLTIRATRSPKRLRTSSSLAFPKRRIQRGGQGGKGQLRSNREKKKPKAEKNKKKGAPVPSVFERVRMIGKDASGKKLW